MSIQTVRATIAEELDAIKPEGWRVSTDTQARIFSGLIHVGHVTDITPLGNCSYTFNLYVTVWVNEAATTGAAAELYDLVTPGDGSIVSAWWRTTTLNPGLWVVETVGQTPEGPTQFLAAVIRIPMTETY